MGRQGFRTPGARSLHRAVIRTPSSYDDPPGGGVGLLDGDGILRLRRAVVVDEDDTDADYRKRLARARAYGVEQVILVSAAPEAAGPHALSPPRLDGRGAFLAMKRIDPDVRVVLTTGYTLTMPSA